MNSVAIEFIPHKCQRYDTAGDWVSPTPDSLQIRVSKDIGEDGAFLVAVHELVEAYLCRKSGITADAVDEFDFAFEGDDPGADHAAPYHKQHMAATEIEKALAVMLGVDWQEYEKSFEGLEYGRL